MGTLMRKRVASLAGVLGGWVVLVLNIGLTPATTQAAYTAQEVLWIHQNRFDVATDLHVKFWQKEDNIDVLNWQVMGTSGGLPMPTTQTRGDQPEPYHSRIDGWNNPTNADNGQHAVDLDWYGLNVPYCTSVDVRFRWTLTEFNVKHKQITWTKDAQPPAKHVPLFGWTVNNPTWDGVAWQYRVTILNLDDSTDPNAMVLYIDGLKFWALTSSQDLDPDALATWNQWIAAPVTAFALAASQSYFFDIASPVPLGRVLGSYSALDAPGGNMLITDVFDHTVPEPTTLGLLALGGLAMLRVRGRRC